MAELSTVKMHQSGNKTKWTYRTAPDGFKWLPFEDEFGYLGVKDKNGKIIIPTFYTNIEYTDGFFIVKDKHSIYSIFLNTGELFVPANNDVIVNYDKTIKNSPFIICNNRGRWRAMARNGKILVPEDFYGVISIIKTDDNRYEKEVKDWVFRIVKGGYVGIVDSLGKVIMPLNQYNQITRLWNNKIGITYSYRKFGNSPKAGICKSDGTKLIENDSYSIWATSNDNGSPCLNYYYNGYIVEADMNGITNIDLKKLPPKNLEQEFEFNGVKYKLIITPNCKMGLEKNNKIIIPPLFDNINSGNDCFLVSEGKYTGIYDTTGNCIIPPNKYTSAVKIKDHYFVSLDTLYTSLDQNAREYLPIKYGKATPFVIGKDTFVLVNRHDNHKLAIFHKGRQLTDYLYRDAGFMKDEVSGQCIGFYIYDNSHRLGFCRLDGKEIIEPMYTSIKSVKYDGNTFYKVSNGNKIGLYDQNGKLLVPPEFFSDIAFSGKKIIATGFDRRCEFNYKGKLLLDSHPNTERDNYIKRADMEFEKEDWGDAAKYYGKAIEYWESASLYFNRAISYYNDSKYNKAIDDFNKCLSLKPSQNLIDRSRALIAKARQLQEEKIARREAFWGNVVGLVLGAAVTYAQAKYSSQSGSSSSYATNSYKRDRSMDYLLDPNYAMQQVQIENWREYMTQTDGGRTMSYEQWYAIKAQSMSNSNTSDNSTSFSTSSSGAGNNSTKQAYGKDCRLCYGSGDCRTCEGRGYYYNSFNLTERLPCPNCYQHNGKCSSCGGTGKQ